MSSQVVLRPQAGQEVQVELCDKDMDKDDFLGRQGPMWMFVGKKRVNQVLLKFLNVQLLMYTDCSQH